MSVIEVEQAGGEKITKQLPRSRARTGCWREQTGLTERTVVPSFGLSREGVSVVVYFCLGVSRSRAVCEAWESKVESRKISKSKKGSLLRLEAFL